MAGNLGQLYASAFLDPTGMAKGSESAARDLGKLADAAAKAKAKMAADSANFFPVAAIISGAKGFYNAVEDTLLASSRLEQTEARFRLVGEGAASASESLKAIREAAISGGQPLAELTNGVQDLVAANYGLRESAEMVARFASVADALNSPGAAAGLARAVADLRGQTFATIGVFDQLNRQGLDVFGALGKRLELVTGRMHDLAATKRALTEGSVLASTASQAIQDAAGSAAVKKAAQDVGDSFEGQIRRLKGAWEAFLEDIGRTALDHLPIAQVVGYARGALQAARELVEGIAEALGAALGSREKTGVEEAFKKGRDLAYEIAEALTRAAFTVAGEIKKAADYVKAVANADVVDLERWTKESAKTTANNLANFSPLGMIHGIQSWIRTGEYDLVFDKGHRGPSPIKTPEGNPYEADLKEALEKIAKFKKDHAPPAGRDDDLPDFYPGGRMPFFAADMIDQARDDLASVLAPIMDSAALGAAEEVFQRFVQGIKDDLPTAIESYRRQIQASATQRAQYKDRPEAQRAIDRRDVDAFRKLASAAPQDSFIATRADKGSAAAAQAELEAKYGLKSLSVQERVEKILQQAAGIEAQQLVAIQQVAEAIKNAGKGPGVVAIPKGGGNR